MWSASLPAASNLEDRSTGRFGRSTSYHQEADLVEHASVPTSREDAISGSVGRVGSAPSCVSPAYVMGAGGRVARSAQAQARLIPVLVPIACLLRDSGVRQKAPAGQATGFI